MIRRTLFCIGSAAILAGPSPAQAPKPEELEFRDGVAFIPDRATYKKLAHQGDAGRDAYLNGIEFVKFILVGAGGETPVLYWMNTKNHQAHPRFMGRIGLRGFGRGGRGGRGRGGAGRGGEERPSGPVTMRGAVSFRPRVRAPNGTQGAYIYDFQPNDSFSFELLKFCYDILLEKAPFLKGKLAFHPLRGALSRYGREKAKFAAAGLPVYLDDVIDREIAFLPMNTGRSYGRLRRMKLGEIPTARDIVFYESLPNELPRVAGMLTAVRQTPLSHVNLRAIQDRVPNAFVAGAEKDAKILALIGKNVEFVVRSDGYTIREAKPEQVAAHFESLRPKKAQSPPLDVGAKSVLPLDAIGFADSAAYGVKTANVAELRKLGLPEHMVPNGFGLPFHFYVAFMKHNGFDAEVAKMLEDPAFRRDAKHRKAALKALRKRIKGGEMPEALAAVLAKTQREFPKGASIRCRSSTNNEDLPGFSGAGLYGSYTHKPDEGHIEKTVKQVYATLWSDRAYEERDFYRIDHQKTAMGVLMHPNFQSEKANGVAVTVDVLYEREGYNYVNAQVGEDMVTNPEGQSVPEEILLPWRRGEARLMQASNRVPDDQRILGESHRESLRRALDTIHREFAKLYGKRDSDPKFAMEIEFKVSKAGKLVIKQARPWVFSSN